VEHSGVDDPFIHEAVEAGGGQIDALSGFVILCPVSPQHRNVVALRDEAWLKTTRFRRLETIPGCPEALPVPERTLMSKNSPP